MMTNLVSCLLKLVVFISFAHASLANPGDKEKALALNGSEMEGNRLKIDDADNKPQRGGAEDSGTRVAMFGCRLSKEEIQEATGASEVFCLDSKMIAFLTFKTKEEADECIKGSPVHINGNDYNVEMARPRGGGGRGGGGGGRGGQYPALCYNTWEALMVLVFTPAVSLLAHV